MQLKLREIQNFKIKFHKIISVRIIGEITVDHKENGLTIMKLRYRYFPGKFPRFW